MVGFMPLTYCVHCSARSLSAFTSFLRTFGQGRHGVLTRGAGQGCEGPDFGLGQHSCQGSVRRALAQVCSLRVGLLGLLVDGSPREQGAQDAVVLEVVVHGGGAGEDAGMDRGNPAVGLLWES